MKNDLRGMVIVYADLAPCRVKNWTVELMQRWVIQRCCWDKLPGKVIDGGFLEKQEESQRFCVEWK